MWRAPMNQESEERLHRPLSVFKKPSKGARSGSQQNRGLRSGKSLNLTSHVRLISIARVRGKVCQVSLSPCPAGQMQKPLETQNRLKCLRAVADGRHESSLEVAATDAKPLAELRHSGMRMLGEPADCGINTLVAGTVARQSRE